MRESISSRTKREQREHPSQPNWTYIQARRVQLGVRSANKGCASLILPYRPLVGLLARRLEESVPWAARELVLQNASESQRHGVYEWGVADALSERGCSARSRGAERSHSSCAQKVQRLERERVDLLSLGALDHPRSWKRWLRLARCPAAPRPGVITPSSRQETAIEAAARASACLLNAGHGR